MPISPYLARLRDQVGTDLLMVPAAVACVFDDRDRLLMVRLVGQHRWGLPGGAIEPGEHPTEAVVREAREEVGAEVSIVGIIDVFGGPQLRHTFPNGDEIQYLMVAYGCRITGGSLRADGTEVSQVRFVSRRELTAIDMPPWGRSVVPRIFEHRDVPR